MLYWIEYQDHPTFEKIFRLYDCYFSLFDLSSQCSLHSLPTPLFKCGNCKPFFTFAHYTGVLIPDFCLNTMMNLDVNNDPRRQRLFLNMYLQRMCSPRQMDLDYSLSQMLHIILSPTKVLVLWFSFWHIATRWLHGESVLGKDREMNCRDQEPMGAWWSVFYSDHDAVCYGVFWILWNDPVDVRYCIFSHCTVFEPTASEYQAAGKWHIVASVGEQGGEIPYTSFIALGSYIKNNQETLKSFLKAIKKAHTFLAEKSSKEVAECIVKQFPSTTIDSIETSINSYKSIDAWKTDLQATEASFDRLQDIMDSAGELTERAPFDKIVDNSLAKAVFG